MTKYKAYNNYKDSEILWLGNIPSHWNVQRTKNLFKLICNPAPKNNNEELLSVYTDIGVRPRRELEQKGNKASTTDNYWIVKKNDIIVNKLLAWMGAIGISKYDGVTSPAYDVLRKRFDLNPDYYNYIFRSTVIRYELKRHSKGIMDMRLRLYFDELGQIKLPNPPIKEQSIIASFLDQKTNEISNFIALKKRTISLLKERKTTIINQAVIKGLDPNVEMTESGIEWLGDIPKHWKIKKLKYLAKIKTGGKDTVDKVDDGIYPFYVRSDNVEKINSYSFDGEAILTAGDGVGVARVFHYATGKFDYHQRVYRISNFKEVLGRFLFFYISENLKKEVFKTSVSTTVDSLRLPMFLNFPVIIPDEIEQIEIVSFIEAEVSKIDHVISQAEKEINLIREYQQNLISEAVTGKIDLRDISKMKYLDCDLLVEERMQKVN
ncbi:restriction endonuclease subunit S [Marinifilum sp.]|uniref:restriction endonuclease subunit S n=1 Tax=Marinifilum sp. TaxID=2033137 RepID=UPI003BAC38BE